MTANPLVATDPAIQAAAVALAGADDWADFMDMDRNDRIWWLTHAEAAVAAAAPHIRRRAVTDFQRACREGERVVAEWKKAAL